MYQNVKKTSIGQTWTGSREISKTSASGMLLKPVCYKQGAFTRRHSISGYLTCP